MLLIKQLWEHGENGWNDVGGDDDDNGDINTYRVLTVWQALF